LRRARQALLFEKRSKNFLLLAAVANAVPPPESIKSFLVLFYKKELLNLA
jgi:hypothetical protein